MATFSHLIPGRRRSKGRRMLRVQGRALDVYMPWLLIMLLVVVVLLVRWLG
jgi:hypothetical protein